MSSRLSEGEKAMGCLLAVIVLIPILIALSAIPAAIFWGIWTYAGIGKAYFTFLPAAWQAIPFLHCWGLTVVMSIVARLVFPSRTSSSK